MKKNYSLVLRRLWQAPATFLLLAMLAFPALTWGQTSTFREAMGLTGSGISAFETITSAEAANDFTQDALTYSGSALGSRVGGAPQGTAPEITFAAAPFVDGTQVFEPTTDEVDFIIAGITTSTLVNPGLTFNVFADEDFSGGTTDITQQFQVQVSIDGGQNFFEIPYTAIDGSSLDYDSGWKTVGVDRADIPLVDQLFIRFVKLEGFGRLFRLDEVRLMGTQQGITVTPTGRGFSNTTVGQQSVASNITVNGAGLSGDITVAAPAGFLVRTGTNAYSSTVTLPAVNGTVANTVVNVVFAPTEAKFYDVQISLTSSGSGVKSVRVQGTGEAPTPQLTVSETSIPFDGATVVGRSSQPVDFTVSGQALKADVIVTPPTANYQIRLGNTGNFTSAPITLSPTNGTLSTTALQVRFVPTTTGVINGSISVASADAATRTIGLQATATAAPAGPSVFTDPGSLDFGAVTGSGSAQTLTFEVGGTNLIGPITLSGNTNNIVFRDAAAGGDFINGPIQLSRDMNNAVIPRRIEVRLNGPLASGIFNGNIIASTPTADNTTTTTLTITANNASAGESTINTSANLASFSTVSGVASASQTFEVSGSNLLRPIVIKAPQFFQVSTQDNFAGVSSTGNSITLPLTGDNVPTTIVYVRYLPAAPRREAGAFIAISSSPAADVFLALTGTSIPNVDVNNPFVKAENIVINTKSVGQGQTIIAERVRQPVTISVSPDSENPFNPDRTPQFEISLDNMSFGSTVTLTPDPNTFRINRQIFVRYAPTRVGDASANLQVQSIEIENNAVVTLAGNGLLVGKSIATQPTQEATFSVSRSGDKATVAFNLPPNFASLGYGEGRLIVASTNAQLPPTQQPQDGLGYQPGNQVYGKGDQVAPGYFAVFAGPNSQATIEGLDLRQTYYFYFFEFNNRGVGSAENYKTPATPEPVAGVAAPGVPLPVELTSFTAKLNKNQVNLAWGTASEKDNKGFEVQRSGDGVAFTTILFKNGQGSSTSKTAYAAVDEQPLSGVSYYRLKQLDYDGKTSLSPVVSVTNRVGVAEIEMYPNPAQSTLNIRLPYTSKAEAQVTITDLSGRVVRTEKLAANSKVNMSSLSNGTYLVTVNDGVKKVTRRIVKN